MRTYTVKFHQVFEVTKTIEAESPLQAVTLVRQEGLGTLVDQSPREVLTEYWFRAVLLGQPHIDSSLYVTDDETNETRKFVFE